MAAKLRLTKREKRNRASKRYVAELTAVPDDIPASQLITYLYVNVKELYSPEVATDIITHPSLVGCDKMDNNTQRMLVNRILTRALFKFRANNPVSVCNVVSCLVPDGDPASWMNIMKLAVIPFMRKHKVTIN